MAEDSMGLVYVLIPIIGAFLILFTGCCYKGNSASSEDDEEQGTYASETPFDHSDIRAEQSRVDVHIEQEV